MTAISLQFGLDLTVAPTFFIPEFSVGIRSSLEKKLGERVEVTNQEALKILKEIRWKSAFMYEITQPIFLMSFSIAALCGSLLIPPVGLALYALRVTLAAISGFFVGFSMQNSLNGELPKISNAYREQFKDAIRTIKILQQNPQAKLVKSRGSFEIVKPPEAHV